MLNLKKGLALVLAAATAFTFAPVANLGSAVDANAAAQYYYFVDKSNEVIELGADESKTIAIDASKAGLSDSRPVDVKVQDPTVAKVEAGANDSTIQNIVTGSEITVPATTLTSNAKSIKITALKEGSTHIELTAKDAAGNDQYRQTLTVNVVGKSLKIQKADETFWKNDSVYIQNGGKLYAAAASDDWATGADEYTVGSQIVKVRAQLDGAAAIGGKAYYFTVSTSDGTVAYVGKANGVFEKNKNGVYQTVTTGVASNTEYLYTTSETDNKITINKDATDNKIYLNLPITVVGKDIEKVDSEHATITVRAYSTLDATTPFGASGILRYNAAGDKTAKLIGQTSFTINVNNATPQLSVSYNPADPSVAADKPVYASGYNLKKGNQTKNTDPATIYLDTTSNKTAVLKAALKHYVTPTFNTNSDVKPEFDVDYQGTNRAITVDRDGKISVLADTAGISEYTNYVVVRVPAVGRESEKSDGNYIPAQEVRIPVKVSTKDRVSLSVNGVKVKTSNDAEKEIKAVGTTGYSESFPVDANGLPDTKGAAKVADIQVSNKNTNGSKNSVTLSYNSNVADSYIDASIYSDAALTSKSDIATYDKATKTITAVPGKSGFAYVKVTALNDNKTYGNASVVFVLEVTEKANNASIAASKTTVDLDRQNDVVRVPVTLTNAKDLVATVKDADKNPEIEAYASSDKLVRISFYADEATADTGSAIVTLSASGKNADTLTPAAQQITVNWHKTKLTSGFWVETQEATLNEGESRYVNYTGAKGAVTFTSADPSVAEVKDNQIIGVKEGSTKVTVTDAGDDTYETKSYEITVNVKAAEKPAAVTGVSVKNKKGAHVTVSWTSQGKNVNYRVYKKVGKGSWKAKNVAGSKTTLSVKKGAKVTVKVKAYVKDSNGKTTWGPKATKAKAFKTDKK